jgi:hypothetical protein
LQTYSDGSELRGCRSKEVDEPLKIVRILQGARNAWAQL